jgi:prepilin-type N-terminal cleavage/methylation domain-containing protein
MLLTQPPVRHSVRKRNRGFTLVELMGVVAIVAILATLAVFGVSKYIQSSKASEAIQMLGSMKAAQEQYRAETFAYLDVSGSHTLTGYYPTATPSRKAWGWGDTSTDQGKAWQTLGVTADAPVRFAYACAAGDGSNAIPAPGVSTTVANWPTSSGGVPWYVVRAIGDLDDDGLQSVYVSSSFTGQIITDHEGE